MPGARPRERGTASLVGQRLLVNWIGRHHQLPFRPLGVTDTHRDRAAEGATVPHSPRDLHLVLLELHPRATAVTCAAPQQRGDNISAGYPHPRGHALQDRDERGAM